MSLAALGDEGLVEQEMGIFVKCCLARGQKRNVLPGRYNCKHIAVRECGQACDCELERGASARARE